MSEIDPKLGELIKKKRIERRLTQEEVAELVGCHPQYYKNLENGKGMPSLPMFCKIMWTLHISPMNMYGQRLVKMTHPLFRRVIFQMCYYFFYILI